MKVLKTIKTLKRWSAIPLALYLFLPTLVVAQNYYAENGTVNFTSSVPLYEFTGTSNQLTGRINLADSTVDFYVDLETLDSGIKKRDKDMRLTLETSKYPFAEFYGKLLDPVDLANTNPQSVRSLGVFSIHGVSKELEVEGEITAKKSTLHLQAQWEIRLEDFDIVPPSLLIVKVDQVQKVSIDIYLQKQ